MLAWGSDLSGGRTVQRHGELVDGRRNLETLEEYGLLALKHDVPEMARRQGGRVGEKKTQGERRNRRKTNRHV